MNSDTTAHFIPELFLPRGPGVFCEKRAELFTVWSAPHCERFTLLTRIVAYLQLYDSAVLETFDVNLFWWLSVLGYCRD